MAALAGVLTVDEVRASYNMMKADVKAVAQLGGSLGIGMTLYPPYPSSIFATSGLPYSYQNGGDWDWFGGRAVLALWQNGLKDLAEEAAAPLLARAVAVGFWEYFDFGGKPSGSSDFHGSAGVLGLVAKTLSAQL